MLCDPKAETKVSADASSFGLGAVLLQQANDNWRPVAYAFQSMTSTERRYAQIEKEALAITWACEKFQTTSLGVDFKLSLTTTPSSPCSKQLDNLRPMSFGSD